MKHIYNYENYLLLEGKNKLKVFATAWNILTLGQGNRLLTKLRNAFSIKGYLIKSKIIKIDKVLSNTLLNYDNILSERLSKVNEKNKELSKKIENEITHVQFPDIKKEAFNILLKYEKQLRILNFNKDAMKILKIIKININRIGADYDNAKLILNDLEILSNKLDEHIKNIMKYDRTKMLPLYELKNIVISVSEIINYKSNNENDNSKQRLTNLWSIKINELYQIYNEYLNSNTLSNIFNISNYNVTTNNDSKLNELIHDVPEVVKDISENVTDVIIIRPFDDFNLKEKEYYMFNINDYNIIMYHVGKNSNNINTFVALGTYKYSTTKKQYVRQSFKNKKYSTINDAPHIFYYVSNLKSYIIERVENISASELNYATHDLSTPIIMKTYIKALINDPTHLNNFITYVKHNFIKLTWQKEYINCGKLTDEFKKAVLLDKSLISNIDVINSTDFVKKNNRLEKIILNEVGWNKNMTYSECKKKILKINNP
jgi:hypothetical protein